MKTSRTSRPSRSRGRRRRARGGEEDAGADEFEDLIITSEPEVAAEPQEFPASPPAMEVDQERPLQDPTGVMRLFYDVARAFVVTRDMRPGENLETDCKLPSTGDDFRGLPKSEIYGT
ncbi:MAG: hypothetical protein R3F43_24875 [bacterium]